MPRKYIFLKTIQRIYKTDVYLLPHFESLLKASTEEEGSDLRAFFTPDQLEVFDLFLQEENDRALRDQDQGFRLLHWGHEEYPPQLYNLVDPPLTLMYQGEPSWLSTSMLSVVGSREPHQLTVGWMKNELPLFFKNKRLNVVSGGARGVDSWAHRLAMASNQKTTVFLPSGLQKIYPSALAEQVKDWIAAGATFVSEYDSDFEMRKHLFQHRNRLIAAMGLGTLIVEAQNKSGTLMTAHMSLSLGKPTWVVPGHPQMPAFQGSLALLAEGAQCLLNAEDLELFWNEEAQEYRSESNFKKVKKSEKSL